MRITKIHLTNFKRFTDLVIHKIPESSRLVLLIGSNGSGKSSLFDAFGFIQSCLIGDGSHAYENYGYYRKNREQPINIAISNPGNTEIQIEEYCTRIPGLSTNNFYGRTSFRQTSRLNSKLSGMGQLDIEKDSDRPKFFIDKDNRFENDIERITESILKELFRGQQSNDQIRDKYINLVNKALTNIFGEGNGTKLQLIEIIPPLEGKIAQINFRKGNSEIHYNYLSAGEKEVINLLLNLLSRSALYQDTVYFFDELDLHLNTRLQYNLLKEICENWIPENCQLWTASHSLGFIEYARQSEQASILDFDNLDFDLPQVLIPEPKENRDVYEIAVGKEFLPALFQDKIICFVENLDKLYYADLGLPNTLFISENNRNSVYHKVRTTQYKGIIDRDFLSDEDRKEIRNHYPNLIVLEYYSIENYLYHPDNLEEYYSTNDLPFNKAEYIGLLTDAKNEAKETIIPSLALKRTGYPFFGEPEYNNKPHLQNRFKNKQENEAQSAILATCLNSNAFEIYYPFLPMKTYCTHLPQRQSIPKTDLARTNWFRRRMEGVIN